MSIKTKISTYNSFREIAVVIFCILWVTLLSTRIAYAQDIQEPSITKYQGLTHSSVWGQNPMIKDYLGRYWIATVDGLNIFDGYTIQNLRVEKDDIRTIVNNSLTTITQDLSGNIWLGTANDGVFYYDIRKEFFSKIDFKNCEPDPVEFVQINGLEFDESGDLWIVPPFRGIYKYSLKDSTLVKVDLGKRFDGLPTNHYSIINLKDGNMSIQLNNGLFIGNISNGFEFHGYPDPAYQGSHQYLTEDGNILVRNAFDKGFYLFDKDRLEYDFFGGDKRAVGISKGIDGFHYMADDSGMYRVNHRSKELQTVSENVNNLYGGIEDVKGNLIAMVGNNQLIRIGLTGSKMNLVSERPCELLKKDEKGQIYFSEHSRFYKYDPKTKKERLIVDLSAYGEGIYNFLLKEDGTFLINQYRPGAHSYNLVHVDQQGKVLKFSNQVRSYNVMKPLDGKAGVNTELYKVSQEEYQIVYPGDLVSKITNEPYNFFNIKNFMVRKNGEIWIAKFNNGIDIISPLRDEVVQFDGKENGEYSGNNVKYISESKTGNIYIQTEIGINIYNPETNQSTLINREFGLDDYDILRMDEDKNNNLWMLTKDHIFKWEDGTQLLSMWNYPAEYSPMNRDEKEIIMDEEGYFYFGSESGIVQFHPDSMNVSSKSNPVHVSRLFIDRSPIYPDDSYAVLDSSITLQNNFEVPYQYRDLGFSFVTVDGEIDNLQYYYRLIGYKDDWQLADETRTIHFTNLNYGDYIFEVKTKKGSGDWNENIAQKYFEIRRPWYATFWAYLLYFLFISTILYVFYRYRIRQLTRYQDLRTRISSDLHDDVGTLLSSVAMQSEVLGIGAAPERKERFEKLSNLSREAMGRMRDTVWAIDSRKDNVDSLIDRMQDYLSDMSESSKFKVDFSHNVSKLSSKLAPDIRQNVYLIFKEAVNNAYKYSNGTRLDIQLNQTQNSIELIVKDNGVVDPEKIKTSGTGLSNMKLRAKRIGGKLEMDIKFGFEVRLNLKN